MQRGLEQSVLFYVMDFILFSLKNFSVMFSCCNAIVEDVWQSVGSVEVAYALTLMPNVLCYLIFNLM